MSWWEAVLLGVVQGITEFFPVSSDGHLVMTEAVLGVNNPGILFEITVHVATLISVLLVYRQTVWRLIRGCCGLEETSAWPYVMRLVVATIPAVIVGFTLKDWMEARFEDPLFTGTMVLVTGSVVWSTRWVRDASRAYRWEWLPVLLAAGVSLWAGSLVPFLAVLGIEAVVMIAARFIARGEAWKDEPTWATAFLMGVAQAAAILPGVSRSGGTVTTALWGKVDPVKAAEFSFMMSIPAILGAAVLMVPDASADAATIGLGTLAVGALSAGITGVLAIRFFVAMLRRQSFAFFGIYCWIAGTLFLLYIR